MCHLYHGYVKKPEAMFYLHQWLVSIRMLKMRHCGDPMVGRCWNAKRLRIPLTRCSHSASPNSSCWSIPVMYWPGHAVGDLTTCSSKHKGNLKQSREKNTMILTIAFLYLQKHQTTCAYWILLVKSWCQWTNLKLVYWGLIILSHANVAVQNYHPQQTWFEHVTPQVFMTRPAHSS